MSAMTKSEFKDFVRSKADARASSDYGVASPSKMLAYPYVDKEASTIFPAVIVVYDLTGSNRHYVVLGAFYNADNSAVEFNVWCGDKVLSGTDSVLTTNRFKEAFKHIQARKSPVITDCVQAIEDLALGVADGCNFWKLRHQGNVCKHVGLVFDQLADSSELDQVTDQLEEAVSNLFEHGVLPGTKVSAAKAPLSKSSLLERAAFRVPVLIEGDRGAGKTTEVRLLAKANGYPLIEFGGHAGVEAIDMLGHQILIGGEDRRMVWKDGAVAEAFRKASKGERVVLLIDEMLRIPQRELSLLLTALSPFDGSYRLRTGRVESVEDGVAKEEVLFAPVENLAIVATTNVGSEYAVDECDPALRERFVVVHKDVSDQELEAILAPKVLVAGLEASLVAKLVKFYGVSRTAKKQGLIPSAPTTRTIVRAVEQSSTEEDVVQWLDDQILLWVGRDLDGSPIAEQVAHCERIIRQSLSIKGA